MAALAEAYERMPDPLRPVVRRWFYRLHPGMSWSKRRRVDRVTAAFVEAFFEDRGEYEAYREEFLGGRIREICLSAEAELPAGETVFDAHRDECAKLYALVREFEPRTVVETGVYHGVSTAALLLGLSANGRGRLHSVAPSPCLRANPGPDPAEGGEPDSAVDDPAGPRCGDAVGDPDGYLAEHLARGRPSCSEPGTHRLPAGREPGWILPGDLRERWDCRTGRPARLLPRLLAEVEGVDLFLQDSVHSASGMLCEFELAFEHLRPGGLVVSPHVAWNDAFETFAAEHGCEAGLVSFEYNGLEGYERPGSCGYLRRPAADP